MKRDGNRGQEHLAWFDRYNKLNNDFIFIIQDKQTNRLGQLSIYEVDNKIKSAKFGRFLVNPTFTNLGMMKTACGIGMQLARDILQVQKLTLEVKQDNSKALHIYHRGGLQEKKLH